MLQVLVAATLLGLAAPRAAAAQTMEDVIYLKDGSVIHGTIVEQRPGVSVLIKTHEGNTLRYTMDVIDKMTKEATTIAVPGAQGIVGKSKKEPGTALLFSLLVPGGGQAYNGEWGKAALMFGGAVVGLDLLLSSVSDDYCGYYADDCGTSKAGIGAILYVGSILWSAIDAPISASHLNRENGFSIHPSVVPLKTFASKPRLGIQVAQLVF
jgi:hypothetical protein